MKFYTVLWHDRIREKKNYAGSPKLQICKRLNKAKGSQNTHRTPRNSLAFLLASLVNKAIRLPCFFHFVQKIRFCPPKRVRLTVAVEFFFSFRFASQKGLRHRTKLAFCETSPALLCNVAKFLDCCRRKESGVLCHCFKYVISVVAVIDKFFMGSAYAFAVKFFHEL